MKRIYERASPLSTILEWLVSIALAVWFIRVLLRYLEAHLGIVIGILLFLIGCVVGYRIYDYKRKNRF